GEGGRPGKEPLGRVSAGPAEAARGQGDAALPRPRRGIGRLVHREVTAAAPGGDLHRPFVPSHSRVKPEPAARTRPPWGAGKWLGRSSASRSLHVSRSFRREAAEAAWSTQATALQPERYTWD